jgi:hypothetical protein
MRAVLDAIGNIGMLRKTQDICIVSLTLCRDRQRKLKFALEIHKDASKARLTYLSRFFEFPNPEISKRKTQLEIKKACTKLNFAILG